MASERYFGDPYHNLENHISRERDKVQSALNQSNSHYIDLITIVRQFDLFYIFCQIGGQPDIAQSRKMLELYRYGWYDTFVYYLPKLSSTESPMIFESTPNAQSWADNVLGVTGKINFSSRHLSLARAGLIDIEQVSPTAFLTKYKYTIAEKEHFDRESFKFIQEIALNVVKERHEAHLAEYGRIREDVLKVVQNPYGKYISYRATEIMEKYYADAGYFHLLKEQGYDEFGEEDMFGGVPYKQYLDFVINVASSALMHIDCCFALLEKKPSVNPYNIFYNWYIDRKIEEYASRLGIDRSVVSQIFSCLILTKENLPFYKDLKGSLPPPFIQTGKDQYAQSIYGSLGAIDFLKRELKRRYEKDYFNAVNRREKRFRADLYEFFPEDRFIKIDGEIILKYSNLHTDIDAVVFDIQSKTLGLFQLKWQDMFYTSSKERYSRISNLFPKATEWIDKIELWLSDFSQREVIDKLTLDRFNVNQIGEVFLFVVARNQIHFTGVEPDPRAAWASLNQIPFSFSRIKVSFDDPIRELHAAIRMDAPEERVKREGLPLVLKYRIELESFTID